MPLVPLISPAIGGHDTDVNEAEVEGGDLDNFELGGGEMDIAGMDAEGMDPPDLMLRDEEDPLPDHEVRSVDGGQSYAERVGFLICFSFFLAGSCYQYRGKPRFTI